MMLSERSLMFSQHNIKTRDDNFPNRDGPAQMKDNY